MEDKTKVHLTKVQETLLITLRAKALDHRSKKPILNDEQADQMVLPASPWWNPGFGGVSVRTHAHTPKSGHLHGKSQRPDQIVKRIDYDFGKLKSLGNDNVIVVRAKQYDEWLKDFLLGNPNAVVLNLGCGLDTRITRVHPSARVHWFDIDYPEVIQLRERFYSTNVSYSMIGSSITNPNWLTEIPGARPTIIIAEGVLEYLTEEEVKSLLNRMTDHFLHGQMAFDVMNSYAIKSGRSRSSPKTVALHQWAVEDLNEVDKLNTKLKKVTELSLFNSPYIRKLPWGFRSFYSFMSLIPRYRNMIRLLRYQF